MEIELILEQKDKSQLFAFRYDRMVNAGYVGRKQHEVRRHIDELEKKVYRAQRQPPLFIL